MDYKQKLDEIKALVFGKEKVEEVELAEEVKEEAPEAAPAPAYVTAQELSAVKDEMAQFKSDVMEMLSAIAESMNSTPKDTVPVEASEEVAEEVKEEVKEEEVELAAVEPLKHDPASETKNSGVKFRMEAGRAKTTGDIVRETLASQFYQYVK